jgi:orotate phosphoribosyltransferase
VNSAADEILELFTKSGALLSGHFVLRSGLHSRQFFQCALLLQQPRLAERVCGMLAEKLRDVHCDSVISPALGGIIVGHELARALGARHIFAEKEDGRLTLRRGFTISRGETFIVAEDVVTRGGRVRETIDVVNAKGGCVAAVAALVDRSGDEKPNFGCDFFSLVKLNLETFEPDTLPKDLADIPVSQPGSK